MQTTKSEIRNPWAIVFIVVPALMWVLFSSVHVATAGYADSAHGDGTDGVNRSSAVCAEWPGGTCVIGSCAHCHDTSDPLSCSANNYMLFYDDWVTKSDMFCFECHSASTEHQQVTNYPYCVNFGGRAAFYGNIKKQFTNDYSKFVNCGSRHHLEAIRDLMVDDIDGWGFSSDPDPCVACHPPHAH